VDLIIILGWKEPLKNHFLPGNHRADVQPAQLAPPDPSLTIPLAPPAPMPPPSANGQMESVDHKVGGSRRMIQFSTPAPAPSGQ
jgi:hypothetical protein